MQTTFNAGGQKTEIIIFKAYIKTHHGQTKDNENHLPTARQKAIRGLGKTA